MSGADAQLSAGAVLAGRWRIQDFIGSGDTGEVYGVGDLHSAGTFALKLFWPSALSHAELWSALQQTARTASGLGVEGIARAHDFGIDANCARPFLVAERVSWASLADRVRVSGPLTPAEMATAFAVLARALDAAHAIGLVHRDLKPENVFVAPENSNWVRLSDFGVALLRSSSPPPPGWGGSVGWVGPDGADPHARATPAMDVFALGLVTFFALTGGAIHRAARTRPIDPATLWQELALPPDSASVRARELGAALDPTFDAWFERALAPDPQLRFGSVGEMAGAFQAIARNLLAPQSQHAVALHGVAAAIAQPLIFQPESLPSPAVPIQPESKTAVSAAYEPNPDGDTARELSPLKVRRTAPLFIAGAVLCFALTGLGAAALYQHRRSLSAEADARATTTAPSSFSAGPSPSPTPAEPTSSSALPAASAAAPPSLPSAAPAREAAAPLVVQRTPSPLPAAPKATSSTIKPAQATLKASNVPKPTLAPKPIAAATGSTVMRRPSTVLSAPSKKKCGSVFLPCK